MKRAIRKVVTIVLVAALQAIAEHVLRMPFRKSQKK